MSFFRSVRFRRSFHFFPLLTALGAGFALPNEAVAQNTYVWNGGSGTWDTSSPNWSGAGTTWLNPTSPPDIAQFGGSGSSLTVGTTIINVGEIDFLAPGYTITGGTLNLLSGGTITTPTITTATGTTATISSILTGSSGLTVGGSGILILNGLSTSTLTGGITINSGAELQFGTSFAMPLSNAYTINGGTLSLNYSATLSNTRTYVLTGAVNQIEVTSGNTITLNGAISGSGGLTKIGAGTLGLAGVDTYSGATTISAGTLIIAADSGLGTVPSSATPNSLIINGGTLESTTSTAFTINVNRGVALGTGSNTINVSGGIVTIAGVVADLTSLGGFTKTGPGVLVLSAANTFTGAVTVSAGTLRATNSSTTANNTLSTISSLTINGGGLDLSSTSSANVLTLTVPSVTLTDGVIFSSYVSSMVLSSPSTTLVNGFVALSLGGSNGITKSGLGTVTLANSVSSGTYAYTGTFSITGGAVYLPQGVSAVLGSSSNSYSINGGALVFGPTAIGSLANTRSFSFGTSSTNVIDGGTGGVNTILGNVTGSAGDGGFNKTGVGTFAFGNTASSGANTYTGTTNLWAGEFRAPLGTTGLPTASALLLSGGVMTVNNTSSPQIMNRTLGTAAGDVAWAANADGGFAAYGAAATVNLNGNATPSTLVWGSTANFIQSGRVLVLGAALANNAVTVTNPIDLNGGSRIIDIPLGAGGDSATLSNLTDSVGGANLIKTGGSPLVIAGGTLYTGSTTIAAGALQFAAGALPPGNIILSGGLLQQSSASAQSFSLALGTGSNQIQWTGDGGFASAGGGALTVNLNGNASTLVWGSTQYFLPAGNTLLLGSGIGTGAVTVSNPIDLNGGTHTVNVAGSSTVATLTLTDGSLTKTGAGTLTLATGSSLSSSGTLTVSAGTLNVGANALTVANVNLTGTLSSTAALTVTSGIILQDGASLNAVLTGGASLTKVGTGNGSATINSAAETFTGATILNGSGRLLINGGSILNSTSITINGSVPTSTGTLNGATYATYGGSLTLTNTNGQDRINTPGGSTIGTLPLTINGGSLSIGANATTSTIVENFASLTLGSGASGLFMAPSSSLSGQTIALNFNSGTGLTTSAGSTLLIAGPSLGALTTPLTKVTFSGSLPSSGTGSASGTLPGNGGSGTTIGVLRGIFGDTASTVTTGTATTLPAAGTGMTTYDANGVRLLAASEYSTNNSAPGTTGVNLLINSTTALTAASATINSLTVVGNTTSAVGFNQFTSATTLTLSSGNVLVTGGNEISSSTALAPSIGTGTVAFTLAFGANTAYFLVGNGTSTTTSPAPLRTVLAAALTGTGGLVKSGPGILTWSPNSASTGTLTGGSIYLNGGILSIGAFSSTITDTLPLIFNGGTLQYTNTVTALPGAANTNSIPVTLNPQGGTFDTEPGGGSYGAGNIYTTIQVPTGVSIWQGQFTGAGGLTKTGPSGGMVLQNNNTYSGGTTLTGGYLVLPTVNAAGTALLTSNLGTGPLTLTTGYLMVVGSAAVTGGNSCTISNAVNFNGESTINYVGPTTAYAGYSPYSLANSETALLTLSGTITITASSHTLTDNNPANGGSGYSLVISGNIGEATSGSNLIYQGVGTSFPLSSSPLYTPAIATPTSLTNILVSGVNTYTGQTVIRQGIVNPSASVLAGQSGPFGNSYLPVLIGDEGGATFAGILFSGNNLTFGRNIELQIAGAGSATASAIAPVLLGSLPGSTGATITGNIQTANRTLSFFTGSPASAPMVVSGLITGSGSVDMALISGFTNGAVSLTGNNTYTGGTTVRAGTLSVDNPSGSGTGSGTVAVTGTGTTLTGTGTIIGPVTVGSGSILGAGGPASPGTLTITGSASTLALANTSSILWRLRGAPGSYSSDLISLVGGSNIPTNGLGTGVSLIVDLTGVDPTALSNDVNSSGGSRTYIVIAGVANSQANLPTVVLQNAASGFSTSQFADSYSAGNLVLTFTPVPEPVGTILIASSALALGWYRCRRARRRSPNCNEDSTRE